MKIKVIGKGIQGCVLSGERLDGQEVLDLLEIKNNEKAVVRESQTFSEGRGDRFVRYYYYTTQLK